MKKEELIFRINQLRQDKIIYAVESCAVSLMSFLCIIFSFFILDFLPATTGKAIFMIIFMIAFLYWIYVAVSNLYRLDKVRKLEQQLQKEFKK